MEEGGGRQLKEVEYSEDRGGEEVGGEVIYCRYCKLRADEFLETNCCDN